MEIYEIIERYGNTFCVKVKANEAMNQGWLNVLNKDCDEDKKYKSFEEAMNAPHQIYLSNDEGFLTMEVVRDLDKNTYYIEYLFNEYEYIDAKLTDEELAAIDNYINEHKDEVEDKNKG